MYLEPSFAFCATERWNSLPYNIRHIQSSEAFKKGTKVTPTYSLQLNCLHNMISEPNDVVSVNFYVSLYVSICMRLYSTVSLVVRDVGLYKCTLLFIIIYSDLLYQIV